MSATVALDAEVGIIGCGPTGVVLANLLGALGVRVWVIDRDEGVYAVPRATHIDEETLRNFQSTGLMAAIEPHTSPFGMVDVVDDDGEVLLADEVVDRHAVHGYVGSRFFEQPPVERALREGLGRYDTVALRTGVEALGLEQRDGRVYVRARDVAKGEELTLAADWVVGCDGGRSVSRGAVGIEMESVAPKRYWFIVDTRVRDPRDAALLPGNFRYVLARERLTIYAHGHGDNRRWEFQLDEGEAPPDAGTVRRWLARFIEPSKLEVLRTVPYAHNSLVARSWRAGRVLLAGDAAHMMPPSAGQGMCSGVRDAMNLAWKLALVLAGRASSSLLDTYERERRAHVRELLEGTLQIGNRLEAHGPFQRWRRRNELKLIAHLPERLQNIVREHGLRRPTLTSGFLDAGSKKAGQHLPQTDVWSRGERARSDDVLGYRAALVLARGAACDAATRAWARTLGVLVLRLGEDLEEVDGALSRWMRDEEADYALVRPDRVIFSAGHESDLARARECYERGLGIARRVESAATA